MTKRTVEVAEPLINVDVTLKAYVPPVINDN